MPLARVSVSPSRQWRPATALLPRAARSPYARFPPITGSKETRWTPKRRRLRAVRPRATTTQPPVSYWTRPPYPTCTKMPPRPDRAPRWSGSGTMLAPSAGSGPFRKGSYASSTSEAPELSWPGGLTNFWPATPTSGCTSTEWGTIDDDTCWCCDTGVRQTRFQLVTKCHVWRG